MIVILFANLPSDIKISPDSIEPLCGTIAKLIGGDTDAVQIYVQNTRMFLINVVGPVYPDHIFTQIQCPDLSTETIKTIRDYIFEFFAQHKLEYTPFILVNNSRVES